MNVVLFFHSQLFPTRMQRPYMYRCGCGRVLFEANNQNLTLTNDIGVAPEVYSPGQKYIKIVCHSCKSSHTLLYQ